MRLLFPSILALGGVAMISSCTTAPAQQARSPHAQRELAEALAGRTQVRRSAACQAIATRRCR